MFVGSTSPSAWHLAWLPIRAVRADGSDTLLPAHGLPALEPWCCVSTVGSRRLVLSLGYLRMSRGEEDYYRPSVCASHLVSLTEK